MSFSTFIDKYKNQIKAMNPKYDVVFKVENNDPITFTDSKNCLLSFCAMADTHLPDRDAAEKNLQNIFTDAENSKESFDALLMAGDIADYGKKSEYERFFRVFDKQKTFKNLFITMGNHDARFLYTRNQKIIMNKVNEYLDIDTKGKSYYSKDIKGYTFIVICTEKRVLEKAHITDEQIAFLDSELKRATKDGKPAFVMCHQPFANTHGLPEVWKTGDMGNQNDSVRAVMEKYKNVFFINGHLHGGIFEKVFEVLNKENNVVSLSVPGYRKENNFGIRNCGTGYYCEVYKDKVIFTARIFAEGKKIEGDYCKIEVELI